MRMFKGFNLLGLLLDNSPKPLPETSPIFVGLTTNPPLDVTMREFMYAFKTGDHYDVLLGAVHVEHLEDIKIIESLQRGQKFAARSGGDVHGVELMFGLIKDEVSPFIDLPEYVPGKPKVEKTLVIF